MKAEEKRKIIDRYEEAYFRANGKPISVVMTAPGWYKLERMGDSSVKRYRLSELIPMTERIEANAAKAETAAKREGFVILVIPPRSANYRNIANSYLTEDGGWFTDKSDPSVKVFELSSEASIFANELNSKFPFKYAIIEPF